MPASSNNNFGVKEPINIPEELKKNNIKNIQIKEIKVDGLVKTQGELLLAKLNREIDWTKASENMDTDFTTSINDYVNNLNVSNIKYYNCEARTGTLSDIDCEKYLIDVKSAPDQVKYFVLNNVKKCHITINPDFFEDLKNYCLKKLELR